ncbi:MAG: hypothetical protein ACFE9S_05410 [Candidatus Hermodarchaeota archaeon]
MTTEVSEEVIKKICQLISTPGNDIEEIAKKVNLDYEIVKEILSDEYFKHNLEYGRRLCCRG